MATTDLSVDVLLAGRQMEARSSSGPGMRGARQGARLAIARFV
jgi:hypothetical protein